MKRTFAAAILVVAALVFPVAGENLTPEPSTRTGGRCLSSILKPNSTPLFAARQAEDSGTDFSNFHSLSPRFVLYEDGHWIVQGFRYDNGRHVYAIAYGTVDSRSLAGFRSFLEEPEIRTWLVCSAGDPRSFTAAERSPGEIFVKVAGGVRIVPAGRIVSDMKRGRPSLRIVTMFQTLGDWIAMLSSEGTLIPDRAYFGYRTVSGNERFYNSINRATPLPDWISPPGFPGVGNLYPEACRTAQGSSKFWCDGWGVAEVRGCEAVDEAIERANRSGNVFIQGGSTREFALTPVFPGLPPLDPSILLTQKER